jgi:CBS domain-containing protein
MGKEGTTMKIKQVMNRPAVTCPSNSTADHAARLMWEFDCGIIPIVDDDGRLEGVVTDRDLCMAAYTQGQPLGSVPVASAMARQVVAAHEDDAIETVEGLMRDHQIRRLPVIDSEHRPIGIVSLNDLARLAAHAKRSGVDRELVQTLAAVCQPRARAIVREGDGAAVAVRA